MRGSMKIAYLIACYLLILAVVRDVARKRGKDMGWSMPIKLIIGFAVIGLVYWFILIGLSKLSSRPVKLGPTIQCRNNLVQIGLAMNLHRSDQEDLSPAHITDLTNYIGDNNVRMWFCPARLSSMKGAAPSRISDLSASPDYVGYDYLSVTSTVPGMVLNENIAPVLCDKPGNHGTYGINILFLDGHIMWWSGTIKEYAQSNSLVITVNTNWLR